MNHLDDDAELYALGLTERVRDAEIEAHLARCGDCRARVVAAEAAAAALAAALPPMPAADASPQRSAEAPRPVALAAAPRRAWWPALASAAALVFAATTAFEGFSAHAASSRLARTDVALAAIASSHFGHTTLTSAPGVVAKALYARDGAWCYVLATGAPRGAHVVLRTGTSSRDVGALEATAPNAGAVDAGSGGAGAPATLFVRAPGRVDEVAVVVDERVVAYGKPAY